MADEKIRVLAVEDDPDFSQLVGALVGRQPDMAWLGCAGGKEEALRMAAALNPQIVLMDLNLDVSDMDGIECAREIRLHHAAKVLLLTVFENPQVVIEASKRAFAAGYLFKSQFGLIPGEIRAAAAGPTPQELMIRSLILGDLTSAELAVFEYMLGKDIELMSSQKTIANQKTNILHKLGLKSQRELRQVFL